MTSSRTFLIGRFIRNARSFYLIFQTLLYPVRLALGDWFLYVRNSRGVPMCSYKSFTPIYTPSIPLSFGLLRYSEVHISQSPQNLFPRSYMSLGWIIDYPSHPYLSSIFRDELASLFCEKAMLWVGTLNLSITEFAKGPRILNMVMTFVLTPRSHCNTIIEASCSFSSFPHKRSLYRLSFTHDRVYDRLLLRHDYM